MYLIAYKVKHENCMGSERPHSVLRRQNPTLAIASDIVASSASIKASTVRLPPTASRSFETAASVTSSLVCEDNMSEMSVANRRLCNGQ